MTRRKPIKTNRRTRATSARDHLLDVRIRTSTARRRRKEAASRWLGIFVLGVVVAVGATMGVRAALDRFFFQNAEYTLRRITLELDGVLTREEALERTGLRDGVNIFSVDLNAVESSLRTIGMVESVRVRRELPDHIAVVVTAREPVAWVAADGETGDPTTSEHSLLVDSGGFLMRPNRIRPEYLHLPVIYGVQSDNIRDGEPLHSEDLRLALFLMETLAKHPESLLRIRTLDISRGYCITVVSDRNAQITFATDDFEDQLARLQKLLLHCDETGRSLESVNLMVKRNTPVTFVALAAEPAAPAAASPTEPKRRTRRN